MPLIDARGRLFGRMNLIDAALLVFVLALLPLGVLTFRIFQEPVPRIDSVAPASQPAGPARRLRVKGANFRPYLRVFLNPTGEPFSLAARNPDVTEAHFLIESPGEVELQLPALPPGSYDLYLFDESRQILAHPSAFRLEAPASAPLRVTVQFVAVADIAGLAKPGDINLAGASGPASSPDAGAVIETLGTPSPVASAILSYGPASGRSTLAVAAPARALDAQLSIPAKRSDRGVWMYRDQPIRPGDTITFETSRYSMRGLVKAVVTLESGSGAATKGRNEP